MPAQPDLELLPKRGTTFELKGLAGFSIEFKKDGGKVMEAVFYQPDSVTVLKKKQ